MVTMSSTTPCHWFAANAPQYQVVASSPSLMFAHIGETNMASMLSTLPITLISISALRIFSRVLPLKRANITLFKCDIDSINVRG